MKILTKRAIATFIDCLITGFVFEASKYIFLQFGINNVGLDAVIGFAFYFSKDIQFKNASIGKKMMGIAVYNSNWNKPTFKQLFIRNILVLGFGYSLLIRCKFYIDGCLLPFFDWEREKLHMTVVDKKVLGKLEARSNGDRTLLSSLYYEYIRDVYGG